jgi:hypothetical protein
MSNCQLAHCLVMSLWVKSDRERVEPTGLTFDAPQADHPRSGTSATWDLLSCALITSAVDYTGSPASRRPSANLAKSSGRRNGARLSIAETRSVGARS